MLHYKGQYHNFRPGDFGEMLIVITSLFPLNVNDSNDNLFLQHFSLNTIVFEPFTGGKGMIKEDLYIENNRFFQKHNSQTLIVCYSVMFHSLQFLSLASNCANTLTHTSCLSAQAYQFHSHLPPNLDVNIYSKRTA